MEICVYEAAFPGRDWLDETVATFIGKVNLASLVHARLNDQYTRSAADREDIAEMSREADVGRAFPLLADDDPPADDGD